MNLCEDCLYYFGRNICKCPANGVSLLDGTFKPVFATTARSDRTCGNEGKYFKSKNKKLRRFFKLFS